MTLGYRIAGRNDSKDLTRIDAGSHFARCIEELFAKYRPRRVIETGTYLGTGTTATIARALRDLQIDDARFLSIECNPKNFERARENLARAGLRAELLGGLSIPRSLLPTKTQIEHQCVRSVVADGIFVDHEEMNRADLYFRETDFPDLPDDLLGWALAQFDYRPDFVLLDSGGHLGHVEFRYLIDKVRGPCFVALDDIHHVKHFRSFRDLCSDERFHLLAASEEKFGFCIARFSP